MVWVGFMKKSREIQLKTISDIIVWIDENLESRLTVDYIAQKSGYTKWYFQRLFKDVVGMSLGHYVLVRRLSDAAMEIKLSNEKIIDVSARYGFVSQPTFSRAFKKLFKKSPVEYRYDSSWELKNFIPPCIKDDKKIIIYSLVTNTVQTI